ncbi:MAG: response regulator transcription factor [Armatimonadia bacterium]
MKQNNPIRMLVADDHQIVREGLVALINRRPDMEVVAQAANGRELVEQFLFHCPDVALVDLRMPEMDGAEAIAAIREVIPSARAIVLTTYDDGDDVKRCFAAGAKAYLLKGTGREELMACIKAVHEGEDLISPPSSSTSPDKPAPSHLSAGDRGERFRGDCRSSRLVAAPSRGPQGYCEA